MEFKIFYAWQSDRVGGVNRHFLDKALREAAEELNQEVGFEFQAIVDRDTSGVPGSPEIAATILDKISQCQVLVADLTLIHDPGVQPRRTPNPNVLLELGYGAATLGWEHVILVVNTAFGEIEELPFDLRGRRALPYSLAAADERTPIRKDVGRRLKGALRTILEHRLRGTAASAEPSPEVLIEPIVDRTEQVAEKPALNLHRIDRVLEWNHTDDEFSWPLELLEKLRTRLARIAPESRQVFRIAVDRASSRWSGGGPQVLLSELRGVISNPESLQDHIHILEEHQFIQVWYDDDRGAEYVEVSRDRDWPDMLADIKEFCTRASISFEEVIVELNFAHFDEVRPMSE
jgi:hypothetical protein